jgi:hypothetical protein
VRTSHHVLGDLGDGIHALNMHIAGISVPADGSMAVTFTILNHGPLKAVNDIGQVLIEFGNKILDALTSGKMAQSAAAAPVLGLGDWEEELVAFGGSEVLSVSGGWLHHAARDGRRVSGTRP